MDVSYEAVSNVVQQFVRRKRGDVLPPIDANTPLLRDGYLDSFALIELIGELEKQLQIHLDDGALIPEDFESPQVLYNRLREI